MDYIKIDKKGNQQHILCNDHKPNPAFTNEFQTNYFTLKLTNIESYDECFENYYVENGSFVLFTLEIKNNIDEILDLYREDFMCSFNTNDAYYPEEYFSIYEQFQDEMHIEPFCTLKGKMIFLGPRIINKIDFFHNEYYDEEYSKEYHLRYRIDKTT